MKESAAKNFKLHLGAIGTLEIDLPMVVLGPIRGPKTVILAGMHGNERTGSWILRRLMEELQGLVLDSSVVLIPVANPIAFAVGSRVDPITHTDLNRIFPGNDSGSLAERLACCLGSVLTGNAPRNVPVRMEPGQARVVSESEAMAILNLPVQLVVDLHTFGHQWSLPTGILTSADDNSPATLKTKELLRLVRLPMIWRIDGEEAANSTYKRSLGPFLSSAGIPNFAIETQEIPLVTIEVVNQIVDGLLDVLGENGTGAALAIAKNPISTTKATPIYRRHWQRSEASGLFLPKGNITTSSLGRPFSQGRALGEVVSMLGLQPIPVTSKWPEGCDNSSLDLMLISHGIVGTGDEICSWGEKVDEL